MSAPEARRWTPLTARNAWVPAVLLGLVAAGAAAQIWRNAHYWQARRSSLETNAIGSCRAYAEAQNIYKRNDWDGDGRLEYAHPFPLLNTWKEAGGQAIQLIDAAFAQANSEKTPKHGYFFADMESIAGAPVNWREDFALCAMPAVYGRTGFRIFIVKTDGRVWGRDFGGSGFVADFPADPGKDGWHDPVREAERRAFAERAEAVLQGLAVVVVVAFLARLAWWLHGLPAHLATRLLAIAPVVAAIGFLLLWAAGLITGVFFTYR